MVELGVSVALLVAVVFVYFRGRRRRAGSRANNVLLVIAAVAAVLPAIARFLGVNVTELHVLSLAPLGAYALHGAYWLIRDRRDIVAGWRAETEEDRRRGLRK